MSHESSRLNNSTFANDFIISDTPTKRPRTPQPYLLRHEELLGRDAPAAFTGRSSASTLRWRNRTIPQLSRRSLKSSRNPSSSSDSGTEADDEAYTFIKALPAPPSRPNKGLRVPGKESESLIHSPLLTPTKILSEPLQLTKQSPGAKCSAETERSLVNGSKADLKFYKRRRSEVVRRLSEFALCLGIAVGVLAKSDVFHDAALYHREIFIHGSVLGSLAILWPLRLTWYSYTRNSCWSMPWTASRLPAVFDPAPLLYPIFLPGLVAFSIAAIFPEPILPNLVLTLATIPPVMVPTFGVETFNSLQWILTMLPIVYGPGMLNLLHMLGLHYSQAKDMPGLAQETAIYLYPLHQTLIPALAHLTTTSLLSAELQLLSTGLVNLLLFASAPPTIILSTLLWLGGIGVFVLCGPAIRWGVLIARIPRWRFRRAVRTVQAHQGLISALRCRIQGAIPSKAVADLSGDEDDACEHALLPTRPVHTAEALRGDIVNTLRMTFYGDAEEEGTKSAAEIEIRPSVISNLAQRPRSYTLPSFVTTAINPTTSFVKMRKRRQSTSTPKYFLSLTAEQANRRKWLYAGYVYLMIVVLILLPIRYVIARYALDGHDPFGWAIGYLFGNLRAVRFQVFDWSLKSWILLPSLPEIDVPQRTMMLHLLRDIGYIRTTLLGAANTRLILIGYCGAVLAAGLAIVLNLPSHVEVDTRRKVFHGMMVAMFVPTIPVDPSFMALALALMLAIFLILDFLRASQLPPLSKPIASFLTPYVDGRDLRGPVIISHIFLLIGCAIPLWLSLAGRNISGDAPWKGWEIEGRDVSMVSGVICVGMGDAAASLIGRRFGRRKWPWVGGKSLEGSAAFALAVSVGLLSSKAYLWLGGWEGMTLESYMDTIRELSTMTSKAVIAACGASFMEAVLTGGNDNVVVPVVLWLLVRAVDL